MLLYYPRQWTGVGGAATLCQRWIWPTLNERAGDIIGRIKSRPPSGPNRINASSKSPLASRQSICKYRKEKTKKEKIGCFSPGYKRSFFWTLSQLAFIARIKFVLLSKQASILSMKECHVTRSKQNLFHGEIFRWGKPAFLVGQCCEKCPSARIPAKSHVIFGISWFPNILTLGRLYYMDHWLSVGHPDVFQEYGGPLGPLYEKARMISQSELGTPFCDREGRQGAYWDLRIQTAKQSHFFLQALTRTKKRRRKDQCYILIYHFLQFNVS